MPPLPLLVTAALLLAAFILLLLISLSVPIIKSIYLLKLVVKVSNGLGFSAGGNLKAGVWGYCTSGLRASIVGFSSSLASGCSDKKLGYKIDSKIADALGLDDDLDKISKGITAALVLHPIACGFAFVALVLALLAARPSRGTTRFSTLLTLLASLLAALFTTAVFIIDIVIVAVVRSKVKDASDGDVDPRWGNAVWMALGAAVALWLSLVFAACGLFQIRRSRRAAATTATY